MSDPNKTSTLRQAVDSIEGNRISIGALMETMPGQAFGLLLLLFTLPNFGLIPSLPLLPLICGLPAMLVAAQMMIGRPMPWLPRWAFRLSIGRATSVKLASLGDKLGKIGRIRLPIVVGRTGRKVLGAVSFLLTVLLCIPLPGLNLVPCLGMVLLAVGIFRTDGALALVGAAIGMLGSVVIAVALVSLSHAIGINVAISIGP